MPAAPTASAAGLDTAPPVLVGVSFSASTAQPGDTVTLALDVTDDVGVVATSVVIYEPTSGRGVTLTSSSAAPSVDFRIRPQEGDGDWRVREVLLADAAGNDARYRGDGTLVTHPATTTVHAVDLSGELLAVSGASDQSPPRLDRVTLVSGAAQAGGEVTYAWQAHDAGVGTYGVETVWESAEVPDTVVTDIVMPAEDIGSSSVVLPYAGRWRLASVSVVDRIGSRARYLASGEVQLHGPYDGTHDLDFGSLAQTLVAAPPPVRVVGRATRVTAYIDTSSAPSEVVPAYLVTVQPAGVTRTVPAPQPAADRGLTVDVPGLPNGVAQTVAVTALSPFGNSAALTRRVRPELARTVAGMANHEHSSAHVVATRARGTSEDFSVDTYESTGRGALRGPYPYRVHDDWTSECYALVAFTEAGNLAGSPLCQRDDLVPVAAWSDPAPVFGARGWASMRFVDGGFDLNGDRTADVIAVDPAGRLRLYAQTSKGRLVAWPHIGAGWQSMTAVVSAGDLTGDRRNDLAAVDAAGRLWLYPGNGRGGVTTRRQIGSGWQSMGALLPLEDFDGDGKTDLGGITPGGDLRLYRGTGTGGVRNGVVVGRGWDRYL